MHNFTLFAKDNHKFVLLNETSREEDKGIPSNQYLVMHGEHGVLLDPGGFGAMPRVLAELLRHTNVNRIKGIILSHQDPDIVGSLSAWLQLVKCPIYIPEIWIRFLPHYGLSDIRPVVGVPDAGMLLEIARGFRLQLLPAHFLHSEGQINVYDPVAKILFSGDIGAAMMPGHLDYAFVDDFESHLPYIEFFHRRYMGSNQAARFWVDTVSKLDIQLLAPQHGPIYRNQAVGDFLAWMAALQCGIDLMVDGGHFQIGAGR